MSNATAFRAYLYKNPQVHLNSENENPINLDPAISRQENKENQNSIDSQDHTELDNITEEKFKYFSYDTPGKLLSSLSSRPNEKVDRIINQLPNAENSEQQKYEKISNRVEDRLLRQHQVYIVFFICKACFNRENLLNKSV